MSASGPSGPQVRLVMAYFRCVHAMLSLMPEYYMTIRNVCGNTNQHIDKTR